MKKMVEAGHFLEYADVHGNLYGTSRAAVEKVAQAGCICILDIDVQGVRLVKARSAEMLRDPGEMRRDAARLAAMCLVYRRAGGPGSSRCVACRRRVWRREQRARQRRKAKEKGTPLRPPAGCAARPGPALRLCAPAVDGGEIGRDLPPAVLHCTRPRMPARHSRRRDTPSGGTPL